MDGTGTAKWLNGNGKDVPVVGTNTEQHETAVYSAGIGYSYGLEEVNLARMLNIQLDGEKACVIIQMFLLLRLPLTALARRRRGPQRRLI